jgi:virginiamycin B lyase
VKGAWIDMKSSWPTILLLSLFVAGCSALPAGSQNGGTVTPQVAQQGGGSPFVEWTIPTSASSPEGITVGSDHNLWFVEQNGNVVGSVTMNGAFTEVPIPTAASQPTNIAAGKSGNLWFTETGVSKIGRLVLASHAITEFATPTSSAQPYAIVKGADGAMWFTEATGNKIGRIQSNGQIQEFLVPTANAGLAGIAAGSDGALWFVESAVQKVGRITTAGNVTNEYGMPNSGRYIASASDHNLWVTEPGASALARVTTAGTVTEFRTVVAGKQPWAITKGNGSTVWFTQQGNNTVDSFNVVSLAFGASKTIPTASSLPFGIAFGPDKNLWFTEQSADKVGVYVRLAQTATPHSINFTAAGQTQIFTVTETNYPGTFSVSGCASTIATVSPASGATSFTVTAQAAGTCVLTVSDIHNNTSPINVTVTTTNFGIN